jgi:hypothetical protein
MVNLRRQWEQRQYPYQNFIFDNDNFNDENVDDVDTSFADGSVASPTLPVPISVPHVPEQVENLDANILYGNESIKSLFLDMMNRINSDLGVSKTGEIYN